jgi:hypothetical protein
MKKQRTAVNEISPGKLTKFSESRLLFGKPTCYADKDSLAIICQNPAIMLNTLAKDARLVTESQQNPLGPIWPLGCQPSSCRRSLRPSPNSRPFAKFASRPHRRGEIQERSGFVRFCSLPLRSSFALLPASTVALDASPRHAVNMNLLPFNDLPVEPLSLALAAERSLPPAAWAASAPDWPMDGTGQRPVLSGIDRSRAISLPSALREWFVTLDNPLRVNMNMSQVMKVYTVEEVAPPLAGRI